MSVRAASAADLEVTHPSRAHYRRLGSFWQTVRQPSMFLAHIRFVTHLDAHVRQLGRALCLLRPMTRGAVAKRRIRCVAVTLHEG